MTDLVVRRLLIDLAPPFARHWNGGDAFRTAFFNALSMSFPRGEQYFIDSVRTGLKSLPEPQRLTHAVEVQGFIGQEATHRRIHALFNGHLLRQGYVNRIEQRTAARIEANAHYDFRVHLAATAATEHFTAVFADWMLSHPEALRGQSHLAFAGFACRYLPFPDRSAAPDRAQPLARPLPVQAQHLAQRLPPALCPWRTVARQYRPVA